jgi:hypothetical protein
MHAHAAVDAVALALLCSLCAGFLSCFLTGLLKYLQAATTAKQQAGVL